VLPCAKCGPLAQTRIMRPNDRNELPQYWRIQPIRDDSCAIEL